MYMQVMYVGSSQARSVLRQYEFFFPKKLKGKKGKDKGKKKLTLESKQDRIKFDVLLTSYEMINLDTAILKALKWECLVRPAHLRIPIEVVKTTQCSYDSFLGHYVRPQKVYQSA